MNVTTANTVSESITFQLCIRISDHLQMAVVSAFTYSNSDRNLCACGFLFLVYFSLITCYGFIRVLNLCRPNIYMPDSL